ncbi:MAG: 30S ribosomal protein S2 [Candidatus Woesearchaeota archaeon]
MESESKTEAVSQDVSENFLVEQDLYLKAGIHIGTKFRTKYMKPFIYKTRPDGLSVLNIQKIDERIRMASNMLSKYDPEDILVVCRRENGWRPLKLLEKHTGIRIFPGRYPPGILTNTDLEDFIEAKILLVADAWPDRNAVDDAMRIGIPIIGICDTNNQANNLDLVVPCNNKGKKSLELFFYVLTREYLRNRGQLTEEKEQSIKIDDFMKED